MEFLLGSSISLAKQATDNVKTYRFNREEQLKILESKIIKQIKYNILQKSLEHGELKYTIDISKDFNFSELLDLDKNKRFIITQKEKEKLKETIINFITEQDFNFDFNFNKIVVKWPDPDNETQ